MNKTRTKLNITRGEKIIYGFGVLAFLGLAFIYIFGSAYLNNLAMNVEKLEYNVTVASKEQESLEMQISELTSFERINGIVKEQKLAYNNNNIIVVD